MDLAELKFVVDTKQLVEAKTAIEALGTAVSKVNKPVTAAAKEAEKLAQAQAKTAEATAKAELAQTKAAAAADKLSQAQEKSNDATGKSLTVLEKQTMILGYMAQGNSKGQASILATAKAAGALDEEMKQLSDTLKTQRTLIGGDPFDKSIGLMQKLQNESKITTEVNNLFNKSLGLTEKQMIDLAREKERLIALYNLEGRDIKGLAAEYDSLIQKSVEINSANTARTNGMRDQIKAQNDSAKAEKYIASEMERVTRLTQSNGDVTSATNNKLIKFEAALKATGASAASQTKQLEAYKTALMDVQKHAGNRQVDYLSRALGPQITDIAVGLATGQSPMMVLLQQGGQLRDQFALAGVAGKDMGKMLTAAAASMVTSVKDVGVAISTAIIGSFAAAGKSVLGFIADITGVNSVIKGFKGLLVSELGMGSRGAIGVLNAIGTAFTFLAGTAIAGAIAGLIAYGVALKKVIDQEEAANRTSALYGGQLGLTQDKILDLSKSYAGTKGNIGSYIDAINEAAKAGNIQQGSLEAITKAAVDLEKVGGQSMKETIKQASELGEKPTEGLIKYAKQLGTIPIEILKQVHAYEQAGKTAEAAKLAQDTYAKATQGAADEIKKNLGILPTLFMDIGEAASKMWDKIMNWGRKDTKVDRINELGKQLETLQAAKDPRQIESRKPYIAAIQAEMKLLNEQIVAEYELQKAKSANSADAKKFGDTLKNQGGANFNVPEDAYLKRIKQEYQDSNKEINSESKKLLADNKANYDLGLIDLGTYLGEEIRLIQDQNKQKLAVDANQLKALEVTKETQIRAINEMYAVESAKNKNAEDGKKLEKQRLDAIKKVNEEYAAYTATIRTNTEVIKDNNAEQQAKSIAHLGEQTKKVVEGSKDFIRTQDDIIEKRQLQMQIDQQLSQLSGGALERAKAEIAMEQSHVTELSKLEDAALKAGLAMSKIKLSGLSEDSSEYKRAQDAVTAAQKSLDEARTKSRTAIAQAGIDAEISYYQKEWNSIQSGVTDALVTALFEGGQAGSKKLRDIIVAELKKPITVVIQALVNATVGSFANSMIGSFTGNAAGGAVGSGLMGAIGSIAVGGSTLAAMGSAFTTGLSAGMTGASTAAAQAAYAEAGMTGVSNGLAAGQMAAPVVGAVGGMALNRGISNGYSTGSGMQTVQDIATIAATAIFGPMGGIAAGAISGVFNRAFGMKAKEITGEGIVGTLTTQGADVKAFEDWFQKGGWFRSNKSGRNYSQISQNLQDYLDLSLGGLTATTKKYADALGIETTGLSDVTQSIDLNLKDLSADERKKKIDEALSGFGDELAKKLGLESYDALQKLGEDVLKQRYDLETQLLTLQGDTLALRARERAQIYETNQALFDQVKALEDKKVADEAAAAAMEKLTSITTTIVDEINRLRGVDTTASGLEAQFAILTTQARAGDLTALSKLPEVTKGIEQIAGATAVNATDIVMTRARLAQSLQDTLGYVGADSLMNSTSSIGVLSATTSVSSGATAATVSPNASNQELLSALVVEVQGLRAEVRADVSHNAKTAKILERANQDGETLSVSATIDGGVV